MSLTLSSLCSMQDQRCFSSMLESDLLSPATSSKCINVMSDYNPWIGDRLPINLPITLALSHFHGRKTTRDDWLTLHSSVAVQCDTIIRRRRRRGTVEYK